MKILSNKRYKELVDNEHLYNLLTGKEFTIYIGGRSLRQKLLQMEKEELVYIIYKLNSENRRLSKQTSVKEKITNPSAICFRGKVG